MKRYSLIVGLDATESQQIRDQLNHPTISSSSPKFGSAMVSYTQKPDEVCRWFPFHRLSIMGYTKMI